MSIEIEWIKWIYFIFLGALGVSLLLLWYRYFGSLRKIDRDPKKASGEWAGSAPGISFDKSGGRPDAGGISERAASTLNRLREGGFAKEADTITEEVDKKVKAIIKEKDALYDEVDQKFMRTLVEKKQIDSIMRSVAEGLVVLNPRGEVIMMNPAAEKILDVDQTKQIGRPMHGLIKKSQLMSLVARGKGGGESEIEMDAASEDAKKVLRASNAVIENENGQTIGIVSVFTDVTKQKELEELKSQFVSNVSHELRTPLVAIRNAVEIILSKKAGPLTGEQDKFLSIADNNLKRLGLLIDDLLDLSKVEAKRAELHPEPSDIGELIKETCDSLEAWAGTKEISISANVQSGIRKMPLDRKRIVQVLTNLIGNSIKFTPNKGSITISANMAHSESGEALVVSVADTGIGIEKEDIPKLFNKFQQLGNGKHTHHISGTGLGLYISKELIALHGGTIWAKSEIGKGSTFVFKIPV